jgi:hypothetical protein
MKSIWFFVGLLLTIIGAIIAGSGAYSVFNPPAQQKLFAHLRPDLWWGIIMLVFGVVFMLLNRRNIEE